MTKLKIKNCVLGRYDNIIFWINNDKYILRPESEIETYIFKEKVEIIFSVYFSKSKKIIINCNGREEIILKLRYNYIFYTINIFFCISYIIIYFVFSKLSISPLIMGFIAIPILIWFMCFAAKYIELSEN